MPNTTIETLLAHKGRHVATTWKDATVTEAVRDMNRLSIGSLVVIERGRAVGIFTERDVLTRVVAPGRNPWTTKVGDVMSADLVTLSPHHTVADAMRLIQVEKRNHLPVIERGTLCGMISCSDLNQWLLTERDFYIRDLEGYITRA